MEIKLIVIRSSQIKLVSEFYSLLGIKFEYHQHANSPMHYSTTIGNTVLEIYPLAKGQECADKYLRLGFKPDNFESCYFKLKENNIKIIKAPETSEFGTVMTVEDPDGRKVELYK